MGVWGHLGVYCLEECVFANDLNQLEKKSCNPNTKYHPFPNACIHDLKGSTKAYTEFSVNLGYLKSNALIRLLLCIWNGNPFEVD